MTAPFSPTITVLRGKDCARVLLLFVLLLPLTAFSSIPVQPLPLQPELRALVAAQPAARVSVIVQKLVPDAPVEALVAQLGGQVTTDLPIINAFAAELPARTVRTLAGSAGIRWISLDAPTVKTTNTTTCTDCINTNELKNSYVYAVGADKLWSTPPYLQGQGIGVAVVDSGITNSDDFNVARQNTSRITASVKFNTNSTNLSDGYGHGTHVAGIIGGNGSLSEGTYIGIAPKVNLISVKVSDDQGMASAADVVNGLQWVLDHKNVYNIRVVNLSLNSAVAQSYHVDPLAAAAEILWFNGIVVVTSAGNTGNGGIYPPANDPFVITVGAMDDHGTVTLADDTLASFSAFGTTTDGVAKPDLVAPGANIVSILGSQSTVLYKEHRENRVRIGGGRIHYFRMSGTSMATPVVAGAAALLLQDEPGLTPDQVKYRLMATARPLSISGTGAGYLDAFAAVTGATTASANTGIGMSRILSADGSTSNTWNSASWGSASWGSASWGSASWGSASWGSTYWGN